MEALKEVLLSALAALIPAKLLLALVRKKFFTPAEWARIERAVADSSISIARRIERAQLLVNKPHTATAAGTAIVAKLSARGLS